LGASVAAGAVVLKENAGAAVVEAGVVVASEVFGCTVDDVGKLKENVGGVISDFDVEIDVDVEDSEATGGLKENPAVAVTAGVATASVVFDSEVDDAGSLNVKGDGMASVLLVVIAGDFAVSDTGVGVVLNENPDEAEKAGVVVVSVILVSAAGIALVAVVEVD
jgi:hypothetical protein